MGKGSRMTETITVTVDAVAHGGHGIARVEGRVCFVPGAIPGDTVRVAIASEKKGLLWGTLAEVLEASPDRIDLFPGESNSAACPWLHFAYPAQGVWKQRIVAETLQRLGQIETEVGWIENPDLRLGYRTRAQFHGDGEQVGFYEPGTHTVTPAAGCPVLHPHLDAVAVALAELKLPGHTEVTVNPDAAKDVLIWRRSVNRRLRDRFPHAQSSLDKADRAYFLFDGVPIVNGCFSQSSLLLNRLLVGKVHALLEGAAHVLEVYCGNGNLSLGLPKSTFVTGIDHNGAAVTAANRRGPKKYYKGGEAAMIEAIRAGEYDAALVDPPRQGARVLMPALAESKAQRLVYVSCDPATLARDLRILLDGGWDLHETTAIDLFPHTPHVETVCLLQR